MQIVYWRDNLYEMSEPVILEKKNKKKISLISRLLNLSGEK